MLAECDHGRGAVTGTLHSLVLIKGWTGYFVRCWKCDLRVRVAGRRHIGTARRALRTMSAGKS